MAKKRAINEQDKINLAKGKKFTKEYQPTPEAKSQGHQKRKSMREMLDYLLEKEITNSAGQKASTQEAITVSLIKQALNGNVKAWEVIRDTIGEKPTDRQEITGGVNVSPATFNILPVKSKDEL